MKTIKKFKTMDLGLKLVDIFTPCCFIKNICISIMEVKSFACILDVSSYKKYNSKENRDQ